MSYPINYPTPQGANIQTFNATGGTAGIAGSVGAKTVSTWVKPQGANFVWFTLIGSGGGGDGTAGGGSGAVTNFMCPAFLIPDSLKVYVGSGGSGLAGIAGADTMIVYEQKNNPGYTLLTAAHGTSASSGGTAMIPNAFTAMGFFQSIGGQGGTTGAISASTTTFLSAGGSGGTVNANYGYGGAITQGFFQTQPIIVGCGGSETGRGGIGCGGGKDSVGGPGMAVIITW